MYWVKQFWKDLRVSKKFSYFFVNYTFYKKRPVFTKEDNYKDKN